MGSEAHPVTSANFKHLPTGLPAAVLGEGKGEVSHVTVGGTRSVGDNYQGGRGERERPPYSSPPQTGWSRGRGWRLSGNLDDRRGGVSRTDTWRENSLAGEKGP